MQTLPQHCIKSDCGKVLSVRIGKGHGAQPCPQGFRRNVGFHRDSAGLPWKEVEEVFGEMQVEAVSVQVDAAGETA